MSKSEVVDPLLECLLIIAVGHGRPLGRDAAVAGLPLDEGRITPALLPRIAERANMATRIVRAEDADWDKDWFPCIALMEDRKAVVVLGMDAARQQLSLREPGAGEREESWDTFKAGFTGNLVLLRPEYQFDERAPEVGGKQQRHWFWGAIQDNWPVYRDALFAAVLINLFGIAMPLFVMNVYDRVVPNQALETLWVLAIGVAIVLLSDLVLRSVRSHFLDLASNRIDVGLSAYIMERVLGLRMSERPISAGSFAANLRSFEMVRDFITSASITALIDLPFTIIFLIVIGWIGWPMVFPALIGMIAVILYAWTVQKPLRALTETTYRAGAQRNATLIESLVGLETIKSISAESIMQRRWEESATHLAQTTTRLRVLSTSTVTAAQFAQQLVALTVVIVGVHLIIEQELTMGGLIACTVLSGRAMAPLGQIAGLMMQYHNARTSLTSLGEIMGKPIERPKNSNFVRRPEIKGAIQFKDVSFKYPGTDTAALRKITVRIQPGEKVGVLGRIGSGKTTFNKLIMGLYAAEEGSVLVDGVDVRQLDPAQLRQSIGHVSQDIVLFYGSLRDNLRMAAPHASDEELVRAARIAGLEEFIDTHPRGFDMIVGERGETLSGGQRQGVALARAVLRDSPILLLDEPTGAMDHSSEETVRLRLGEFFKERTVILITHRNALLSLVDRLLVIDAGRIVADGPKDRVVAALRTGQIEKAN